MEDKILNILLVEDDEKDVIKVKQAFETSNISTKLRLYLASNGLEALNMLRSVDGQPPLIPISRRLLLLDLNLPIMDGIEFLQALRTDSELKSIPVVVITGSKDDKKLVEAYDRNVAGYILKPVATDRFFEAIATVTNYWARCEMV
jgi:hypothetical protein